MSVKHTAFGLCKLCGKHSQLIESHIIPRSVINWIKRTSATGHLRSSINPEKRIQDGIKKHLLCSNCDGNLIGSSEKYFMEKIFLPYHEDRSLEIDYTQQLHYFAASLAYRIILLEEESPDRRNDLDFEDFRSAKSYLRRYLLKSTSKLQGVEHFLLVTNDGKNTTICDDNDTIKTTHGLPRGLVFHLLRSFDSFAFYVNNYLVTMAMLPGFIFFTVLKPRKYKGRLGKRVETSGGKIRFEMRLLLENDIYQMLLDRSNRLSVDYMSRQQSEKLEDFISKNSNRWNNSETKKLIHSLHQD
ncbi:hypothetical protein EHF33_06785 [Deinococcus psychrotolerans]|uniref:HNH endonuclease 5 domain-containing protein n=1 Tax=Deinococcus psychrotolerans TaxID=2489213 RepID=A0A3G8YLK4_9DEIO|nr:hypothetical protein [Deinococcus psychrotolerans]AZI42491.1 hypothetical protein EHF33_06785 [Deinococcus psychrotolerans]